MMIKKTLLGFAALFAGAVLAADNDNVNEWHVIWTDPEDPAQHIDIRYHEKHPQSQYLAFWEWDFRNESKARISIHYKWQDSDNKLHHYWSSMRSGEQISHSNGSGVNPEVEVLEVKKATGDPFGVPAVIQFPDLKSPTPQAVGPRD